MRSKIRLTITLFTFATVASVAWGARRKSNFVFESPTLNRLFNCDTSLAGRKEEKKSGEVLQSGRIFDATKFMKAFVFAGTNKDPYQLESIVLTEDKKHLVIHGHIFIRNTEDAPEHFNLFHLAEGVAEATLSTSAHEFAKNVQLADLLNNDEIEIVISLAQFSDEEINSYIQEMLIYFETEN